MHDFLIPKDKSKEEKYRNIVSQIESLVEKEIDIISILSNISAAIHQTFKWLWVGFYIVKGDELILGPFQGPVACFRIKKGEHIGIYGETGSGKSTFIDLLMGLLKPTSGTIFVDNKDIYDNRFPNRVNEWKLAISHVPQEVYLADCSIAENIAFGIKKDQFSMKKIKEAAKIAQINEFIESKVEGFNLRVGENFNYKPLLGDRKPPLDYRKVN